MKTVRAFILCIQFFTSIPVPLEVPADREHIKRAIQLFPVLGVMQGVVYSLIVYVLLEWTPLSAVAVAFFLSLAWIFLTGGLHLDGWMDVSDAYFSFRDPEKRLDIMKDSRIGAFGVLSVIILLSARFLFMYETIERFTPVMYVYILLIPFFGKMMMGTLLVTVKQAKPDGLGALFKKAASKSTSFIYFVYAVLLSGTAIFLCPESMPGIFAFLLTATIFVLWMRKKVVRWFGGMTGDVNGAAAEGGETLLWMILWLLPYSGMA